MEDWAPQLQEQKRHATFLIDCSGSMSGYPNGACRRMVEACAACGLEFDVVTFTTTLDDANRTLSRVGGVTDISTCLLQFLRSLSPRFCTLFVISDCDDKLPPSFEAEYASARGPWLLDAMLIHLSSLASETADRLRRMFGNRYINVSGPGELNAAVDELVAFAKVRMTDVNDLDKFIDTAVPVPGGLGARVQTVENGVQTFSREKESRELGDIQRENDQDELFVQMTLSELDSLPRAGVQQKLSETNERLSRLETRMAATGLTLQKLLLQLEADIARSRNVNEMIDQAVAAKGLRPTPFAIATGITTRHVAEQLGIVEKLRNILQKEFCQASEAKLALQRYVQLHLKSLSSEETRQVNDRMTALHEGMVHLRQMLDGLEAATPARPSK